MHRLLAVMAVCVSSLVGGVAPARAETPMIDRTLRITVRNYSRETPETLERALNEVARLFRPVGVSIEWLGVRQDVRSLVPGSSPNDLHLMLLDRQMQELDHSKKMLLGMAPMSGTEQGHVAYVFLEPVEYLSDVHAVDSVLVLAHVIAHELGHLLLPARYHAPSGLMLGRWSGPDLRAAARGEQRFSSQEAALIRAAMGVEPASVLARR